MYQQPHCINQVYFATGQLQLIKRNFVQNLKIILIYKFQFKRVLYLPSYMGVGASFLEKEISSFEETWIAHMLGIH